MSGRFQHQWAIFQRGVSPDIIPPSIPTGLVSTGATDHSISLQWNAATDAGGSGLGGYVIWQLINSVFTRVASVLAPATTYTVQGLTYSTSYSFRVSSFDNAGNESATSSTLTTSTTADNTAPTIPQNLTVTSPTANSLTLNWSASSDPLGSGVAGYRIYRSATQFGTYSQVGTATVPNLSFLDLNLSPSTTYWYKVTAYDVAGNESGMSGTATGTTASAAGLQWNIPSVPFMAPGPNANGSFTAGLHTYGLLQHVDVPVGVNPFFTLMSGPAGIAVGINSGVVSFADWMDTGDHSIVVRLTGSVEPPADRTFLISTRALEFIPEEGYEVAWSGDIQQGTQMTVYGPAFGAGPTEAYHFTPYLEALPLGATLNGSYGQWRTGTQTLSIDTVIVSDPWRGKVCEKLAGDLNSVVAGAFLSEVPPNTWVYSSYWTKRDNLIWDTTPTQGGQQKTFRITSDWHDLNAPNPSCQILYSVWKKSPNNFGADQTYMNNDVGIPPTSYQNFVGFASYTSTEWIRIECEYFLGDPDGIPTQGTFHIVSRLKNSLRVLRSDSTPEMFYAYSATNPRRYLGWHFQNYLGDGYQDTSTCKHDDHFVQVGTRARFELADTPVWADSRYSEVQTPRAWADNQVGINLNLGGWTSPVGLYLHRILDDGTAVLVGQFIEQPAYAPTNVTLNWTAPTLNTDGSPIPPTGNGAISYYRVEWGKNINGTFGEFINAQRVLAPTTTLSLNLPPGDYAFRVTTVLNTGYESVPFLLGFKPILDANSLRPLDFPAIPSYISRSPMGLTAPYDLREAGARTVTPTKTYGTTIPIGAGYAAGGFICQTRNAVYRLDTDIVAPSWAIGVAAGNILLDLNGHTITYLNEDTTVANADDMSACGIRLDQTLVASPNLAGTIEIINGTILQGNGHMTGGLAGYGRGANPIRGQQLYSMDSSSLILYRGLTIRWHERNAGGIHHYNVSSPSVIVEYCDIQDEGNDVYNRSNQHAAIGVDSFGNNTEVRWCRVRAARHVGIKAKKVHHNEIWADTWWTNGCGVLAPQSTGVRIYENNIYVTGCHPQGIFVRDTAGCQGYKNWIESRYTRPGRLLEAQTDTPDDIQNFASSLTFRFGADQNFQFYGNTGIAYASNKTVPPRPQDPAGHPGYDAEARNVFYYKGTGQDTLLNNKVYGNLLVAINLDGAARAFVLGLSGLGGELTFYGNRLISNYTNFWLSDEYTGELVRNLTFAQPECIIRNNWIVKLGTASNYRTIRHGDPTGYPQDKITRCTFEANYWEDGAWPVTTAYISPGHTLTWTNEPGSVT